MSAVRYSGEITILLSYVDASAPHVNDKGEWVPYGRDHYKCSVSRHGKSLWIGTVYPAAAGFGEGIGYDSSEAFDSIARSAIAFADDDCACGPDALWFDRGPEVSRTKARRWMGPKVAS